VKFLFLLISYSRQIGKYRFLEHIDATSQTYVGRTKQFGGLRVENHRLSESACTSFFRLPVAAQSSTLSRWCSKSQLGPRFFSVKLFFILKKFVRVIIQIIGLIFMYINNFCTVFKRLWGPDIYRSVGHRKMLIRPWKIKTLALPVGLCTYSWHYPRKTSVFEKIFIEQRNVIFCLVYYRSHGRKC
jgi:hypothetical protein